MQHVAVLVDTTDAGSRAQIADIEEADRRLKMRASLIELRQAADLETAFKRGAAPGAQAYMVSGGFFGTSQMRAVVDHILRACPPCIPATGPSKQAA